MRIQTNVPSQDKINRLDARYDVFECHISKAVKEVMVADYIFTNIMPYYMDSGNEVCCITGNEVTKYTMINHCQDWQWIEIEFLSRTSVDDANLARFKAVADKEMENMRHLKEERSTKK